MSTEATERGTAVLPAHYATVRRATDELTSDLEPEDFVVQSMPEASPAKWHLAHTTWFFEAFVLAPAGEPPIDPSYGYLFNSYYDALGPRHERPRRGLLSRPSTPEIRRYRAAIDEKMERLLAELAGGQRLDLLPAIEVGLNHEQQHQELLLTDIKHAFAQNPLRPAYRRRRATPSRSPGHAGPLRWIEYDEGPAEIGHAGEGFAYDIEAPRHRVHLRGYALADRLVTCGELAEFVADGGYDRPELWLADGWAVARAGAWRGPLYWEQDGSLHTLDGTRAIDPEEPVCHVSHYEADAFARWAGARLPTEAEWENAAARARLAGNLAESGLLHPAVAPVGLDPGPRQLFGDAWEWTANAYLPYPGYQPWRGALGEYNGKFMSGQMVLRGGSCATPASHLRATYRNFFAPASRWQFSGIRLARDA